MKVTSYISKYFFPRALISRFLLIIAMPVIIAQLVALYIFYQRHWTNILNANATTIAREVKLIAHLYTKHGIEHAASKAKILYMNITLKEGDLIKENIKPPNPSLLVLTDSLQSNIKSKTMARLINEDSDIEIYYKVQNGTLVFTRSVKHLIHPTTYIFIIWMISLTSVLLLVSLVFTRNQIRSILSLAKAADDFVCGSGSNLNYKPSGATEIRKAGFAFLKMKSRIDNYIIKRTQTLAMISHDLKTPLTRINLQLEMMNDGSEEIKEMKSDVTNMNQMIQTYLDFARGEGGESMLKVKLLDWFQHSLKKDSYKNLDISYDEKAKNPTALIKPIAFSRAMDNILGNANKYASKVTVSIKIKENSIILDIEDNGKGIPNYMKKNVFTPFYRIDSARNVGSHGSVGLGLSITNEIIVGHNGTVSLLDGEILKGLKVRIILPYASS